ncbi:MAG: hypothetical protein RLZZ241_2019 [Bacteroidota bacterium]
MKYHTSTLATLILVFLFSCASPTPPEPLGPLPSPRQLAWHELQYYAFVHFNMNTFTDREWGTGAESPEQFNPSELDARQWAKVAKDAGMQGIILTAKHHDGFCLWPTKTTKHSVKQSPWRNGNGDLVKEVAEACKAYGLKFGIYLSPWDRNNPHYGTPEYVTIFHEQLKELLTSYGPLFEVWFDGANGGSGYYGGANETRKIDNKKYYEWETTTALVRKYQPDAVIFSDGGPDVRWVGTEDGWAGETNWSIMKRDEIYPGWERYVELRYGHEDGTHWLPAEVNTSIRPGWYYHAGEDHQVKTLSRLVRTYYESIGRNGNFLLNLPVDKRGVVHETDAARILALKQQIDLDFETELGKSANATASNTRGNSRRFGANLVNDNNPNTYWATDDGVHSGSLELEFTEPTSFNRILLRENIALGQRIKSFSISAKVNGKWQMLDSQTTIGNRRILKVAPITAKKIRLNIHDAKGPIVLSEFKLFKAPLLLVEPEFSRDREGVVTLTVPDSAVNIYYTLNGSNPQTQGTVYAKPFKVLGPTLLTYVAKNPETGTYSDIVEKHLDIPKKPWKVVSVSSGNPAEAYYAIDENPLTHWTSAKDPGKPQDLVLDLGQVHTLSGFTYWPNQDRYPAGIITAFEFYCSLDGLQWQPAANGEFENIVNSRIEQKIKFPKTAARFIKLKGVSTSESGFQASIAEIGVITD